MKSDAGKKMTMQQTYEAFQKYFDGRLIFTFEHYSMHYHRLLGIPPSVFSGKIEGANGCLGRMATLYTGKWTERHWLQQVTSFDKISRPTDFCRIIASSLRFKKQTLLVDANGPGLSQYFQLKRAPGVGDIMAGHASIDECIQKFKQKNGSTIAFVPQGDSKVVYTEARIAALCEKIYALELPAIISTPSVTVDENIVKAFGAATSNTYGLFRFDATLEKVKGYQAFFETNDIDYLLVGTRTPEIRKDDYRYIVPGLLDAIS